MEEHLPYKKEVGGSIPPYPNDIIISVKKTKLVTKKQEISDRTMRDKWSNKMTKIRI